MMAQLEARTFFSMRTLVGFGGGIAVLVIAGLAIMSALANGRGRQRDARRSVSSVPEVRLVRCQRRSLTAVVDQPGFVQAYEQTAIYSKVSGFIKKYFVDIGQSVKKGDLVVEIFVPELGEEHQQKVAQVELDRKMVKQGEQLVVLAKSKLQTAIAQLAEAKANVDRYEADIVRWESEMRRLQRMVDERVVDREVLDETQKQLSSSRATRDAALAAVHAHEAARASAEAEVGKAQIDVETAQAQVRVAEAEERRTAAMLAYTKVTAPYDGIITVRNANTGDFVQAATGDKTANRAAPMFVISRDDLVRIFVDVPEEYARYVREGTKAIVRADALSGLEIKTVVTRTSWSLSEKTRTLWAEIDLSTNARQRSPKNDAAPAAGGAVVAVKSDVPAKGKEGETKYNEPPDCSNALRPGNYVHTQVIVGREDVWMLPQAALVVRGNQTYCYVLRDGKAFKTPVAPGLNDGDWVEVVKMKINDHWGPVTGGENVILGALDELTDGQAVNVVK